VTEYETLTAIISFLLGALSIYLTAYAKEKGKNKALKEDVFELENEKQKILAKFQTEMEEIKKQHSLDVKKREFKYIDKREQFSKYFALLEGFHSKTNAMIADSFQPIIGEFLVAFMNGTQDEQNIAIHNFSNSVHVLSQELNSELLKLKTETHGVRLISSDELDLLLNELEMAVTKSTNDATAMTQFMSKPEFWADQTLLKPYEEQNAKSGKQVAKIYEKVKLQMKAELNII
jgi:hypothetical protein